MNTGIEMGVVEYIPEESNNEPIIFESKQELNEYIENFIVEFLTEGDGNDNGTD